MKISRRSILTFVSALAVLPEGALAAKHTAQLQALIDKAH
jgi:hypothetical protein